MENALAFVYESCYNAYRALRRFCFIFLPDDVLDNIISKAEDDLITATIIQNKSLAEIRRIIADQLREEGMEEIEIRAEVEKHIRDLFQEGR